MNVTLFAVIPFDKRNLAKGSNFLVLKVRFL